MTNELYVAAAGYLNRGLPVIALAGKMPNGKVHRHGLHNAFTAEHLGTGDEEALFKAFTHRLTTGVGIVIPYPYVVVDIDGEEGAETWKALVGDSYLPDRWCAKTGRGLHLWYGSIEATGSMKLGHLLDLKGQGGYVAAPPSLHPDGHRYEWLLEPGDLPPTEAPDALLRRIHDHNFERERAIASKSRRQRIRHQPFEGGLLWASFGFEHLYKAMREEPAGNRNNYLHWAAATMAEEGATDEEFELLLAEAKDLGSAGRRTVRSARRGRG